jgi:hypothetical protein
MRLYGGDIPFFIKKQPGFFVHGKGKTWTPEHKACRRSLKRQARKLNRLFVKEQMFDIDKHHTG